MTIRRCVPKTEQSGIMEKKVMHHHMEDILQEIKQPRKFSNQVFIGLLYSMTVLNG